MRAVSRAAFKKKKNKKQIFYVLRFTFVVFQEWFVCGVCVGGVLFICGIPGA